MTTSWQFTEFTIPTAHSSPLGIVAGPDGNLWFTEGAANNIGKVTVAGVFKEYPVPTANAGLGNIAAGPDGNLWFTESRANQVAKITTSGFITEYSAGITANSSPSGIAAGPDGNLWFTESGANQVAKVTSGGGGIRPTPPGVVTEYPVPTAGSSPTGIALGPDRNLWFTEYSGNNVARMTTAGAVTEFAIPTAQAKPEGITAGPDGALWFAESGIGKVARFSGSGTITEFPTHSASTAPWGIAAGPDGNVWFTENASRQVGRAMAGPSCTAIGMPNTKVAQSWQQYSLADSDGATWQEIDATHLRLTCTTSVAQATVLTANADLWTANAGYNQDLGIFVSDNGTVDQLLAWKESGGFAGTYSPNAAFVQAAFPMAAGHTYVFKLKWKTNKPAFGATIFAAAGASPVFSPTSLFAETYPVGATPSYVVSTTQYTLANSNGVTWQPIDGTNLTTTLYPAFDATALLGANADLWTANAGFNQDIGIFVSDNGGTDSLVAWKESGGFAGTFSPNAAFVRATYSMTGGHAYAFTLKWKTNKAAGGATIFAAAGSSPTFSPTSLLVASIPAAANPYAVVSTSQFTLPNSDGTTWLSMDANLRVSVTPTADVRVIISANADLWTANAGFNQDIGIFYTDSVGREILIAWKESGGFGGTYSPNAAYVQANLFLTAGNTVVFNLKWKTNKSAVGSTIYAAAGGPAPYSSTRLTVELTAWTY
jgi:streptogramin lyase